MATRTRCLVVAGLLALAAASAEALEFRSVGEPSILYETPSAQGRKVFIISAGTPVEVVVDLELWVKVREPAGSINWISRSALRPQRTVMIVAAEGATGRESPNADARKTFEAAKDVVLDLVSPPQNGWIQVRHLNGAAGYVRVNEVWGL